MNGYYLRTHLADFVPDDAEKIEPRKWREDAVEARGYHERHFEDAFNRYLGRQLPSKTRKSTAGGPDIDASAGAKCPEHPSHPSQRSRNRDSADKSHASGATDGSITPASCPPHPSQDDKTRSDPGGASGSKPHAQPQQKEVSAGVLAEKKAAEASSGRGQNSSHGRRPSSDISNKDGVIEFPRGVSARRRRKPKAED